MKLPSNLHKSSLCFAVLALILIQVVGSISLGTQLAHAQTRTLTVPDNYPTITAAIGNATQGDTILVKQGIYYENPTVDKSVSLVGSGSGLTVVVGEGGVDRGARPVFTLAANGISLSGFTIRSTKYNNSALTASGINVNGDNCKIIGNSIEKTYYGIFISLQSQTTISENNITATLKDGIRICGGSQNKIQNNNIQSNAQSGLAIDGYSDTIVGNNFIGNGRGIGLGAAYSLVFNNNLTGNAESGLYIASSDSIITQNTIAQSKYGIYFTSFFAAPTNNTFYHNNIIANTQPAETSSTYNGQLWDNGKEGNYWSSYIDTDANGDGIGDSPFTVYASNADAYPNMAPFTLPSGNAPPALPSTPQTVGGTVALWHFDEVTPNGATPDAVGNNPVVLEPTGDKFTPLLVDGKVGNALRFNGTDYAYVTASPTLQLHGEITIDAWVNVQQYKEVAYDNIVVECMRTPDKWPTRIMGFAINGETPQNSSSPAQGALRGFFLDDQGVFNEIVTTQPVVPLNRWIHVVFVRSLTNGMHIYVNDQEQTVQVTSGLQNPTTNIAKGTEFYIGHDSQSTIDEVSISAAAITPQTETQSPALWAEWWFWATLAAGIAFLAGISLFIRQSRKHAFA